MTTLAAYAVREEAGATLAGSVPPRVLTFGGKRVRLAEGLRRLGYVVEQANSSLEVEPLAMGGQHSALVLDASEVGGLRGIRALIRRLRGLGWKAVIVVIGLREASRERIAGLDAGADDSLSGQVPLEELAARLAARLRRV